MRAHPAPIRYALLACVLHVRTMEVTDDAVRMLLEIIRRMDTQTEKHLQKELLRDIKRVTGKVQLLYRIAEAVVEEPDGTIRDGALSRRSRKRPFGILLRKPRPVGPSTASGISMSCGRNTSITIGRCCPWVLEHLTFRSENRFQPVIEALAVIKQSLGTKGQYFPEECPARRRRAAQLA